MCLNTRPRWRLARATAFSPRLSQGESLSNVFIIILTYTRRIQLRTYAQTHNRRVDDLRFVWHSSVHAGSRSRGRALVHGDKMTGRGSSQLRLQRLSSRVEGRTFPNHGREESPPRTLAAQNRRRSWRAGHSSRLRRAVSLVQRASQWREAGRTRTVLLEGKRLACSS